MEFRGEYGVSEVNIIKGVRDFTSKGKSPMTTKELAAIQKRLKHLFIRVFNFLSYKIHYNFDPTEKCQP